MAEPTSFEMTWRNGAYYVSIPNYKGGTVYTAAEHDRLTRENEALRDALERIAGHDRRKPGLSYDSIEQLLDSAVHVANSALKEPGQ